MNDHLVLVCLTVAAIGITLLLAIVAHKHRYRDPQRLFSRGQKALLLSRAGYHCEYKHPLWRRCRATTRLEADHVMPWSRGGPTEVWNGQILCHRHNIRKSNIIPAPLYRWRLQRRRRKYTKTGALAPIQTRRPHEKPRADR